MREPLSNQQKILLNREMCSVLGIGLKNMNITGCVEDGNAYGVAMASVAQPQSDDSISCHRIFSCMHGNGFTSVVLSESRQIDKQTGDTLKLVCGVSVYDNDDRTCFMYNRLEPNAQKFEDKFKLSVKKLHSMLGDQQMFDLKKASLIQKLMVIGFENLSEIFEFKGGEFMRYKGLLDVAKKPIQRKKLPSHSKGVSSDR